MHALTLLPRHTLAAVASLPLLLGCSEETTETPTLPLPKFAEAFQDASCDHAVACSFMPDKQTCLQVYGVERGVRQSVASATAGTLGYDEAVGAACVAAVRSAACSGSYLIPRTVREQCDGVFTNRKAEGEACFHAAECQGLDAACEGSSVDSCVAGTCRLSSGKAKMGESCADKECDLSTYCAPDMMGAPVCTAKVGPGEQCPNDSACVDGYACDPGTATCFKQADSGAQCNPDLPSDGCIAIAEYCDPMEKKCKPFPAAGKACANNALGPNICAPYAVCDTQTMTCAALPVAGQACPMNICMGEYLGSYGVVPTLRCANGTCENVPLSPDCTAAP